jgi:hypothetical protein
MLHTTDGAHHWSTVTIWHPDSVIQHFYHPLYITQTTERERLYVWFCGKTWGDTTAYPLFSGDFLETTNGGTTWRVDSSIGGARLYDLCSPAPEKLWAFVGIIPAYYVVHFNDFFGTNALFYSPNDGKTWFEDSTAGDSLTFMRWPDAQHGYITAWRDSTLFIYRFVSNAGVVSEQLATIPAQLYPNPATTNLNITSSIGTSTIHLYDVLGREALSSILSNGQSTLDVSRLPRGIYSVVLERKGELLPAGKVAIVAKE